MQLEREQIQQWLQERSPRESLLVFLVGLALIYFVWYLLFQLPLSSKRQNLAKRYQELSNDLGAQKQNLASVERLISSSAFTQNIAKQRELNNQSASLGNALSSVQNSFIPVEWLARLTNDVIAQQEEVTLISLKSFSAQPWLKDQPGLDSPLIGMQNVYRHEIELEFQGAYFNTIAFLGHLEKLPWHLYWDKLDYQVLQYPEAKVVARFYVLSNQKG